MADYFRKKAHTNDLITTFDDVLLLPGYTSFGPSEVDISTTLGEKYKFNLPIMSAAMDTVTEEEMAIKMALFGGLGVLHRNCSYEKQIKMVRHVKRARSFVIEDVATILPEEPLYKAKDFLENYGISGLVVVDENNKVWDIY
jgi:IMP dehydrogenase